MLVRRISAAFALLVASVWPAVTPAQTPIAMGSGLDGGFALASDSAPMEDLSLSGCADGSCGEMGCEGDCGGGCGGCGNCGGCGSRVWARAEYIFWWVQGANLPPLVTTSPPGTPQGQAGVLGDNFSPTETSSILYGGARQGAAPRSGGRIQAGYWLDDCQTTMVAGDFFALGDGTTSFTATNDNFPILARPFFNVQPDQGPPRQDAALVSFPDIVQGGVNVRTESEILGAGAYLRHALHRNCGRRLDLLVGYRYLRVDDYLQVIDGFESIDRGSQVPVGTTFDSFDAFNVKNDFHGAEIGGVWDVDRGPWGLSLLGRVALGNVHQRVGIRGSTIVTVPNVDPVLTAGGLLTQPTNIGNYSRNQFGVLPEVQATLSYRVNPRLRATLGYTFMYLSNVARAANQVDLNLNPTQFNGGTLSGPAQPAFAFHSTDIWLHGFNVGAEYKY